MLKKLLGEKLHFDRRITIIVIVSTLLLMVDYYNQLTPHKALDRLLLYFVIPMLIIIFVFRDSPKEYGFQIGDWKAGITITALAITLIAPILWWVAKSDPDMQAYYAWQMNGNMPLRVLLDLFGWEFIFRGWILFGYARKFDHNAIWLQAVPFALGHLGKPQLETLTTIFGGFVFGWIAWRTRSFIYPLLIHWFVSAFTIVAAAGALG